MRSLFILVVLFVGCQATHHMLVHKFLRDHSEEFLGLMTGTLSESVHDLLKSSTYADQSMEKPGLSKLFREQSDRRWEEGISYLQKFLQRGGDAFRKHENLFAFYAPPADPDRLANYTEDLLSLREFSDRMAKDVSKVHRDALERELQYDSAAKTYYKYDADIAHFLEEKLEEEFENLRHLSVLSNVFRSLGRDKLAKHMFDANL